MNLDEQAIFGNYQKAMQHRQQEQESITPSRFDAEEQEYCLSVFGEVKLDELDPESNEPFFVGREKCTEEAETQAQQAEIERFSYYYKSKV